MRHPPDARCRPGPRGSCRRRCACARRSSASRCSPRTAQGPRASSTRLRELAPDACPVVAYGALIPRAALDIPRHGWVNLHFSLLPAWRGAAPVQHAVMAGDEVTGASTFLIEEGLDTGPVLGVMTETIRPDRHRRRPARSAGRRPAPGCSSRPWTGSSRRRPEPVPQPAEGVSLAPKITVEDARIAGRGPRSSVDRQVRGCTPAPGAWTTFRGERLKALPVTPAPTRCRPSLAPGESCAKRRTSTSAPRTGPVALGASRPHGKKPMPAADWARGVRIEPGERFGDELTARPEAAGDGRRAHAERRGTARRNGRPSGPGPPTRCGSPPTR